MKSQKMWVILLAAIFSDTLAAPMTTVKPTTTMKPMTTVDQQLSVEALRSMVEELGLLRKFTKENYTGKGDYASWKQSVEDRYVIGVRKLKSRTLEDIKNKVDLHYSAYLPIPFFNETVADVEPKIEQFEMKIKYYEGMLPFKFAGDYLKAKKEGYFLITSKLDPDYNANQWTKATVQAFYNELWKKRNLPLELFEYEMVFAYWQEVLKNRVALDKLRGPSQEQLFAYHKYLSGPEPPGGFTNPPWITKPPEPKWVVEEDWCSKWFSVHIPGSRCTKKVLQQ